MEVCVTLPDDYQDMSIFLFFITEFDNKSGICVNEVLGSAISGISCGRRCALAMDLIGALQHFGSAGTYVLQDAGRMGIVLWRSVVGIFQRPFRFAELIRQLRFVGAGSVVVIFFTALSTGMVLGLQGYYSLSKFGAEGKVGSAVSLSLIMELGPVLTALMVTGRVGSAMCAELGIMRISEQIDALECMAVNPYRYLVAPKLLATIIAVPLLTAIFDLVGIFGGYVASVSLMGVNPGSYIESMLSSVTTHDVNLGIIKSLVFAVLVAWICTGRGLLIGEIKGAGFGAESVSVVTTQAVVIASISVLIFDYLLTAVLL